MRHPNVATRAGVKLPVAVLLTLLASQWPGTAAAIDPGDVGPPIQAPPTFSRGRQLSCSTQTSCTVKNMPLVAQCGSAADPVDADVTFACGAGCATTSHMMLISAAWANRNAGSTYPIGSRSSSFLALPPVNANGRNSWILRVNSKNNGSYWAANPKAFHQFGAVYPAYSLQNAVYDRAPASTVLSPAGCDINQWWTCEATGPDAQSWWQSPFNDTRLNNTHFKTMQDNGWVTMISFFHQTRTVFVNGATAFIEYKAVNPHKVAVNGYNYTDNLNGTYALRINDPGAGIRRSAWIGIKYAGTVVSGGVTMVTALPWGAASLPYLKYSDENEIKLMELVDYIWMR